MHWFISWAFLHTSWSRRKEDLWPHVREFADRAIEHVTATLSRLHQVGGGRLTLH